MKVVAVLMASVVLLAVLEVSEGCFWRSKQQQTPEWLTKQSLNEFNSALDKDQKNRGRRDVSDSDEVVATVTPTETPTSFWDKFSSGAKKIYNKAKDDAKTLADRLEENLGL